MPEPDQEITGSRGGYRSPYADDPALPRWGARCYWILLGVFVAYDLLLLGFAIAAPTAAVWIWLAVCLASQAAFVCFVHRRH